MKRVKRSTFFLVVTVVFFSCKTKGISSVPIEKEYHIQLDKAIYEIVKIDSVENVYLIYGKRNDSIFKIASTKVKMQNCNSIKKGDKLVLTLKSSFRKNFYQKKDIAGVNYNGVLIRFDKTIGIVRDIFTTENIKGICYIK